MPVYAISIFTRRVFQGIYLNQGIEILFYIPPALNWAILLYLDVLRWSEGHFLLW